MKQEQRLQLRQSQNLAITQQLKQSLEILQMSSIELEDLVSQELEKNPFLSKEEEAEETPEQAQNLSESATNVTDVFEDKKIGDEVNESYEPGYESSVADDFNSISYKSAFAEFSGEPDFKDREKSLREHLIEQINVDLQDNNFEQIIASHLLDFLSDSGYLQDEYKTIPQTLGCTIQDVEMVLRKLQRFDPIGIFARNLKECLSLQLKERGQLSDTAKKILDNLDIVAANDLDRLCKICGITRAEVGQFILLVKSLNPKPGNNFSTEHTQVVIPDVFLRRKSDFSWHLELNNEVLPRVLVNKKYSSEILSGMANRDEKKYINEQISGANFIVRAINQRAETILKVSTELVKAQKDFFDLGVMHLKSLTLKEIADKLGIHESTVSRVVNNKFISSPRGIFEMRYFFSSGVSSNNSDDGNVSSNAIKFMIKELIDGENKAKPISDDKIADVLNEKGLNIARRTVAKYRESMNIQASSKRKI